MVPEPSTLRSVAFWFAFQVTEFLALLDLHLGNHCRLETPFVPGPLTHRPSCPVTQTRKLLEPLPPLLEETFKVLPGVITGPVSSLHALTAQTVQGNTHSCLMAKCVAEEARIV